MSVYGSKSFCCIDKKGVLSWPNPTAEKVFMLTDVNGGGSGGGHSQSHRSVHAAARRHGRPHHSAAGDHHASHDSCAGHALDVADEATHTPARHLHAGKGVYQR